MLIEGDIMAYQHGDLINNTNTLTESFIIIMNKYVHARKNEEFTGHELGSFLTKKTPELINNYLLTYNYIKPGEYVIEGSIGQGVWAYVPWIAIMDKDITVTTQQGVYVVYLFSKDMERVYLTFNQGVTKANQEELLDNKKIIRETLDFMDFNIDDNVELTDRGIGQKYELSTIAYREYKKDDLINERITEKELIDDLLKMMRIYKTYKKIFVQSAVRENEEFSEKQDIQAVEIIDNIKKYIKSKGFIYPDGLIENFYLSLKTKPFVLLAGISGIGKTRLVRLFAEALGCKYKLISVRPDWSDGSDLLGYKNIQGKFVPGAVIDYIKKANENPDEIYFLCLDEMNLARVEYYFSDFLSKMETRRRKGVEIVTDKLLDSDTFEYEDDREKYGDIIIPENLYIVGTVNMDETTHPFSKKVLDRANTIEFNEVYLANFKLDDGLETDIDVIPFKVNNDFLKAEYLTLKDCLEDDEEFIMEIIDKLVEINNILQEANLQVGYRVRDELCFYMLYNHREELLDKNTAFDFQLMQKILPRIQGSGEAIRRVLVKLFEFTTGHDLSTEEGNIGEKAMDYVKANSDLLYPRSATKLAYMLKRFEEEGFTSYWL
ncbi:MAG: DUF3578 domain-containing protein [Halanaerobiales bacterium]